MQEDTKVKNEKRFSLAFTAKDLTRTALCVALIAVCAWISIRFIPNMPFTLQVFGVAFAAYFLGVKDSLFAVIAYLLIGLIGAPVFNGGMGGVQQFAGYTGGFLVGFIPMALVISLFEYFGKGKLVFKILGGFSGHIALYIVGNIWFVFVQGFSGGAEFFSKIWTVIVMMAPFFAIDIVKIVGAGFLADLLKKHLK